MCIKSFPFSVLMNISQGLKLRWDLCFCKGESGGEGLGGDTPAVATAVCLGVKRSHAQKSNRTILCVWSRLNALLLFLFLWWSLSHFNAPLNVEDCDTCRVKSSVFLFISMHGQTCEHAFMQSLWSCGACLHVCVLWISHRYMSALQRSQGALI